MKLDTSDYYPWSSDRKRPAELEKDIVESPRRDSDITAEGTLKATETQREMEVADAGKPESEQDPTPAAPPGAITNISHLLSWVLSPVVTPTLGIIAVFELSMLSYAPTSSKLLVTAIVFALTCMIPCAAIFVLTKFGDVSDMALTRRTDRLYPYIITMACLLGCGYYLMRTGLPLWIGYFYIGAAAATFVNLIINFKWKISAHGCGIGGLIAMLMILNRYGLPAYNLWIWIAAAFFAGGLLGAARVWLSRHTPMQTICGEIVGFVGVLLTETFFNQ